MNNSIVGPTPIGVKFVTKLDKECFFFLLILIVDMGYIYEFIRLDTNIKHQGLTYLTVNRLNIDTNLVVTLGNRHLVYSVY